MPGSFHGINMASSALRAFQRAMETSGNNLANVNTRGYSRQRTNFEAMEPMKFWSGAQMSLGTGVQIESITRARDMFLEVRYQGANGDLSRFNQYANGLTQVESIYREPGEAGISSAMNKMFDAFSGLASNPNDATARTKVRDSASLFASRVRSTYSELNTLRQQTASDVQTTISQINLLGNQIATLNEQIRAGAVGGGAPNTLLDQRDTLVRDLSQLTNVTTSQQSDGTINVFASNFPIVTGDHARAFPTSFDAATQTVTDGQNTFPVRGGALLGQLQTINRIDKSKTELDTLANTMRTQFNALYQTGTNSAGLTGQNFFNDVTPPTPQSGAIDFDLAAGIAADPNAIASGTTGAAGDGGLALAMSQLRDVKLAALGTKTFQQFHSDNVTAIATEIDQADANAETFSSILNQIEAQTEAVSGVNMDEEMSDLMRYQRSYQAAARVLTIMDQVTEDIINMVNR